MRCLCAAPDCRSCGPAQGWHVHSRRCWNEEGTVACGQRAYEDQEPCCQYCQAPADTDICAWQQAQIEGDN
jgi:hypothetical protein